MHRTSCCASCRSAPALGAPRILRTPPGCIGAWPQTTPWVGGVSSRCPSVPGWRDWALGRPRAAQGSRLGAPAPSGRGSPHFPARTHHQGARQRPSPRLLRDVMFCERQRSERHTPGAAAQQAATDRARCTIICYLGDVLSLAWMLQASASRSKSREPKRPPRARARMHEQAAYNIHTACKHGCGRACAASPGALIGSSAPARACFEKLNRSRVVYSAPHSAASEPHARPVPQPTRSRKPSSSCLKDCGCIALQQRRPSA